MAVLGVENLPGTGGYTLAGWLFLRLLGVVYFAAFLSLAVQIKGLVGAAGILPAVEFLHGRRRWGIRRFYRIPTLFWLTHTDKSLVLVCWCGAALSAALILGLASLPVLVLLWVFYLSLFHVGRIFLAYQWDTLLLETGFLAIFIAPMKMMPAFPPASEPPVIMRWLLWWLLFRLMFWSGLAKLQTGDRAWRNLTALHYHYETQPLPTSLAWYAHRLPMALHKMCAAIMFGVEILAPMLIFTTPVLRQFAGVAIISLMVAIQLTGNYCFFNLLGISLSFLLFDDRALAPILNWVLGATQLSVQVTARAGLGLWVELAVLLLIVLLSAPLVFRLLRVEVRWPSPFERIIGWLEPFHFVNSYGLFSVMTTFRAEIIIEGSRDGVNWSAYEFKWKPGEPKRHPCIVAPHQPRLDWQMWFAALGYYANNAWFTELLWRLLEGSPAVVTLLSNNPFPGDPPREIRAVLYDYRFSNPVDRRATGSWWLRERKGFYCPPIQLDSISDSR